MDWYRRYHGTCADPKFRLVARGADVPTPFAICAWDAILEHASAHADRGAVDGMTAELLAMTIDISEEKADSILAQFMKRGMISEGRVARWGDRQRPSDDVARRVRQHRERVANTTDGSNSTGNGPSVTSANCNAEDVTSGDGNVTSADCNNPYPRARATQIRTEQSRERETRARRADALESLILDSDLIALATAEGRNPQLELEQFADDCRANGRTYLDYRAAFRKWLRQPFGKPVNGHDVGKRLSKAEAHKLTGIDFIIASNLGEI